MIKIKKNVIVFLINTKLYLLRKICELESYLEEKKESTLKLEDLTPNLSVKQNEENKDILNTYIDSLDYGVKNKNVINIALTGGFGTGKSTILNEFTRQFRENNYLRISLADFNETNYEENDDVIETSILQQIIYFEKKEKLKESSFKRIKHTKWWHKFFMSSFFIAWLYSCVYLFFESINKKIAFLGELKIYENTFHLIFIMGLFYFIFKTFDTIKNFRLSKLTPNDFEITNDKSDHHLSVFNRKLEEIIYYFEKTDTNIVIIEDIDRFKPETAQRIFSKIRELSLLIKESKNIPRPVKFIYAVKDELLTDTKTKFFDLIIPILPIIDFTNSKNIFLDKLKDFIKSSKDENESIKTEEKNNNLKEKEPKETNEIIPNYLDEEFVSEFAYYISDMRTIINICNEYKIYHKIQTTNKAFTNQNKLFSLIFYKNLFPEDFAKIQTGNSNLHKIFNREDGSILKSEINDVLIKRINEDIEKKEGKNGEKGEIETKIDNIQNHQIKDIKELRKIYLLTIIEEIYKKNHNPSKIEGFEIKDLVENEEDFNSLKKSRKLSYHYLPYNYETSLGKSFYEIGELINKELSFEKREKIIKDFHNQKINQLNNELRELYWEKNEIEFSSVQKLFEIYPEEMEEFIKQFYEITEKDENGKEKTIVVDGKPQTLKRIDINFGLVKNLIRKGYLTEDFTHYLSFFHEGSLKYNDYKLLMRIRNNEKTNFIESIDNAKNLVHELSNLEFKNNNKLLIIDIFKELLINSQIPQKRNPKLNDFLYQVTNFNDESAKFLELFLKTILIDQKDNKLFSNFIVEFVKWDSFWLLISTKFEDDNLKRQILLFLFQFFNEISSSTITYLNKNNSITNFINNDSNFLIDIYDRINIPSFIKTLKELKVSFVKINYDEKIKDLLEEVYKNNQYVLNTDNVLLFANFDTFYDYNEKEFIETNYTFLKNKSESLLWKRINDNLNEYLEKVYLKFEENNKEKASTIQDLLEKEHIKENIKKDIITKGFEGKIKSLEKIKEYSVAELLFNNDKIECSWQSIIEFTVWENYDFDLIANFINNNENYKELSINNLYDNYGNYFGEEKEFYDFTYKLISCKKLNVTSFKSIFNESTSLKLNSSEIKIDNLYFIKDNGGKMNPLKEIIFQHLIEKNYIELNKNEYNFLIKNNKKILIKLIEKNEQQFIEDISNYDFEIDFLESLIDSSISKNNKFLIVNDKEDLIIFGDNIKLDIANKITDLLIKSNFTDYSSSLFKKLISLIDVEINKIEFFNFHFKNEVSDFSIIEEILKNMGEKFKKILNKEKVTFEATDINKNFLKILKDQQIINNFKKQKDNFIIIN